MRAARPSTRRVSCGLGRVRRGSIRSGGPSPTGPCVQPPRAIAASVPRASIARGHGARRASHGRWAPPSSAEDEGPLPRPRRHGPATAKCSLVKALIRARAVASFLLRSAGSRRRGAHTSEETTMSRTAATVLAVGLVAASPLAASASGLEVRLGALFPRAQSDLFSDDATPYPPHSRAKECTPTDCPPVRKSDWIGVYGGAELRFGVAPHTEPTLSVDRYSPRLPT